ncbi:MAG: hypothetical protein WCF60_18150 [Anaerobacillus sp.]
MKAFLRANAFRILFLVISVQFIEKIIAIIHVRDAWNVAGVIMIGVAWVSIFIVLVLPKKYLKDL